MGPLTVRSSAFAELSRLLVCTHSKLLHFIYYVFRRLSNTNLVHSRFRALAESEERKHSAIHRLRRLVVTLRGRYDARCAALAQQLRRSSRVATIDT